MPGDRRELTREDLPDELTAQTIRRLPVAVLRRLAAPGNGVLDPDEQVTFDAALHQAMSEAAGRVSRQIDRSDWADVRRGVRSRGGRRGGASAPPSRVDEQLRRLTRQIDRQVDVAEALAPGVDWSFAQPDGTESAAGETTGADDGDAETVSDLEQRLTEQVELVQVMSEIADVSKRTYALEQQRDLQTTRGIFFGFVVSVAVLIAGWAPIVAADDWSERWWILGLTVVTCVAAGLVYALVRSRQNRRVSDLESEPEAT